MGRRARRGSSPTSGSRPSPPRAAASPAPSAASTATSRATRRSPTRAAIAAATDLPVNGDLENGFGDAPDEVAATITGAIAAGLAGRLGGGLHRPARRPDLRASPAVARVAAAAEAAHAGPVPVRAHRPSARTTCTTGADLTDTIERLQAFQEAGADVLYAPGLRDRRPDRHGGRGRSTVR